LTYLLRLVGTVVSLISSVFELFYFAAKKIPIEHILAATRGAGRSNVGGSRANGTGQTGNVNLDENTAKPKDACNC